MDQSGSSPPETLPKWLTEEYFRFLFRRKSPGEDVTVENVTVKFADEERVHGRLIRATVHVASPSGDKTLSYVVKRPEPGHFSTTPASANMYRMEALILGEVIPAMEKVLDAVAPGKFGQLAPRLVDYALDENRFLMTEDLSVQDFSTGNRQVGVNLDHSLAFVKHLAAFHAASVAVMDRYQSEINAIPLLIDSEEIKFLNEFIATSMQGVVSVIDSWADGSEYADQIRQLGASLPSRLAQANRAQPGGLNVLCHGDMFVNNILFRGGGGVRLVDFQLARVGCFADDLGGFLVSCVSDDVLRDHWERLIEEYRVALNDTLRALGHSARALSQEAVREALRAQRAVAQFALFHMLPHTRAPGAVDLLTGGEAFSAPAYHRLLRLLLPRFRTLGWLDESDKPTENLETQIPSWLNRNYFQLLLQQQSTDADLRVQRIHVIKSEEESTSTTDVFQAAVEIFFPSGVETKFFRVRCPGDGMFCEMPVKPCMLGMETLVLGKLVPVAEEIAAGAVTGKFHAVAPSPLDHANISSTYIPKNYGFRSMFHHKSSDLKFCLAIIRHLALFHAASMIALEQTKISEIPTFPSSLLKEHIKTSIKTTTSHLVTRQKEKLSAEKEQKLYSDLPDERVQLDVQETIVKRGVDNEQKLETKISNELAQLDTHETIMKDRSHENEQEQCEKQVSKIGNVDNPFNKSTSSVRHINRLVHTSGNMHFKNLVDNITGLSNDYYKTLNTTLRDLAFNNQERSEILQSQLAPQYLVDRISFLLSPQASSPKEVGLHSGRNPPSAHPLELVHCRLAERFLPRVDTTSCVHVYT